jgi:hypothetical protein
MKDEGSEGKGGTLVMPRIAYVFTPGLAIQEFKVSLQREEEGGR